MKISIITATCLMAITYLIFFIWILLYFFLSVSILKNDLLLQARFCLNPPTLRHLGYRFLRDIIREQALAVIQFFHNTAQENCVTKFFLSSFSEQDDHNLGPGFY